MAGEPESAAEVLFRARTLGRLSQVELAKRAGLTQSVISAYESGRRQPSLPALVKVVDAAGYDLVIELVAYPQHLAGLNGPVGRRVRRNRAAILATAEEVGVTNIRVFGSVARGEDRPDSDVDLLVDLPESLGLFGVVGLQIRLRTRRDRTTSGVWRTGHGGGLRRGANAPSRDRRGGSRFAVRFAREET